MNTTKTTSGNMKKALLTAAGCLAALASFAQDKGRFDVFDFGDFRLHVYYSNDVMADASFIVEGTHGLVAMEFPLFKENAAEFDRYIGALGKPLEQVVTDYHEGSSGDLPQAMPAGMPAFMKGAVYGGMMEGFRQAFGDSMVELPTGTIVEIPFDASREWAGVPFTFLRGATSDFPAASILIGGKVYYTHWAPAKAHMSRLQISSAGAIDAELAEAEKSLRSGAELFVGGHGGVAGTDAVKFKIEYLKTLKKLLTENETPEAFADALKNAFPNLPGAEGVTDLAKALYE